MAMETRKTAASRLSKTGTNGRSKASRRPVRPKKVASAALKSPADAIPTHSLRSDFGLSQATFSKMVGVSSRVLTAWEANQGVVKGAAAARVKRVAAILARLDGIMRRSFIPTWIEQPNKACKETGGRTPLDLFEKGDYEAIEDMIWYAESGTPG